MLTYVLVIVLSAFLLKCQRDCTNDEVQVGHEMEWAAAFESIEGCQSYIAKVCSTHPKWYGLPRSTCKNVKFTLEGLGLGVCMSYPWSYQCYYLPGQGYEVDVEFTVLDRLGAGR